LYVAHVSDASTTAKKAFSTFYHSGYTVSSGIALLETVDFSIDGANIGNVYVSGTSLFNGVTFYNNAFLSMNY